MIKINTYMARTHRAIKEDCSRLSIPVEAYREQWPGLEYVALDEPELVLRMGADLDTPWFGMYLEITEDHQIVMDSQFASLEVWADMAYVLSQWRESGRGEHSWGTGPDVIRFTSQGEDRLLVEIGVPSKVDPQFMRCLQEIRDHGEELLKENNSELLKLADDEKALHAQMYPDSNPRFSHVFPEDEFASVLTAEGIRYFKRMMELGFTLDGCGPLHLAKFEAGASG